MATTILRHLRRGSNLGGGGAHSGLGGPPGISGLAWEVLLGTTGARDLLVASCFGVGACEAGDLGPAGEAGESTRRWLYRVPWLVVCRVMPLEEVSVMQISMTRSQGQGLDVSISLPSSKPESASTAPVRLYIGVLFACHVSLALVDSI